MSSKEFDRVPEEQFGDVGPAVHARIVTDGRIREGEQESANFGSRDDEMLVGE